MKSNLTTDKPDLDKLLSDTKPKIHQIESTIRNYVPTGDQDWNDHLDLTTQFFEWLQTPGTQQWLSGQHRALSDSFVTHTAKALGHVGDVDHIVPLAHYKTKLGEELSIGEGDKAKKVKVHEAARKALIDRSSEYLRTLGVDIDSALDAGKDLDEKLNVIAHEMDMRLSGGEKDSFRNYINLLNSEEARKEMTLGQFYQSFDKFLEKANQKFRNNTLSRLTTPVNQYFSSLSFHEKVDAAKNFAKKQGVPLADDAPVTSLVETGPLQWYTAGQMAKQGTLQDKALADNNIDPALIDKAKAYAKLSKN